MAASVVAFVVPATASSGRVALVRQDDSDPTIAEALHRIRGELVADGFEVSEVDAAPEPPPGTPVEAGPLATIDLSVDQGTHVAELRVIDHLTNKTVIRRTLVDDSNTSHPAELLAVRAVELLRASLLELLVDSTHARPGARSDDDARAASRWAAKGLPPPRESDWSFEIGACLLADVGGIPPAFLALARVRRTVVAPLALRLTVAGLGTESRLDAAAGTASVSRDVGLVEVVLSPWRQAVVHPVASVGGGTLYTSVDGQPNPPYTGKQSSRWAAAGDAGVGAEARLGQRFAVALEGHALFAEPYPAVEILGVSVAHASLSFVASLSVMGSL
jgi:hypothetical protein